MDMTGEYECIVYDDGPEEYCPFGGECSMCECCDALGRCKWSDREAYSPQYCHSLDCVYNTLGPCDAAEICGGFVGEEGEGEDENV